MSTGTIIVFLFICGGVAAVIGQKKNFNPAHAFVPGAVLGVIGIFIVAVQRPNLPKAPPGMRAVRCPRCNAVQNIPNNQSGFERWQCKLRLTPQRNLARRMPENG
jgi:LSD1 subclass zinc finger protein